MVFWLTQSMKDSGERRQFGDTEGGFHGCMK